ncbi:hypothetical protein F5146DRAFT_1144832 [Armillaria mellea]|nr:hypothetical protein F5146DRAFT_1144832 [Armillaria mellea]
MSNTRSKFIVVTNDDRNFFVLREDVSEYTALITSINRDFPSIRNKTRVIQTRDLAICAGRFVDIQANLWAYIKDDIDNVRVQVIETQASWVIFGGFARQVMDMNKPRLHAVMEDPRGVSRAIIASVSMIAIVIIVLFGGKSVPEK